MAEQDRSEVSHPDYTGLTNSLLPPNTAFFPAWNQLVPQQWQTNVQDFSYAFPNQSGQALFNGIFPLPPLSNDQPSFLDGGAQSSYETNGHGTSESATQSTGISERNSTQVIAPNYPRQDRGTNSGTNLLRTPSALQPQATKPSPQSLQRGALVSSSSLAELKMKARESILAKRSQSIRSSSNDSSVPVRSRNILQSTATLKAESALQQTQGDPIAEQVLKPDSDVRKQEQSNFLEIPAPPPDSAVHQLRQELTPHLLIQKLADNRTHADQSQSQNHLGGSWKATSVELEDLLAEGRAAAEYEDSESSPGTSHEAGTRRQHDSLNLQDQLETSNLNDARNILKLSTTQHPRGRRDSKSSLELGEVLEEEHEPESSLHQAKTGHTERTRAVSAKTSEVDPERRVANSITITPTDVGNTVTLTLGERGKVIVPVPRKPSEICSSPKFSSPTNDGRDIFPPLANKSVGNDQQPEDHASPRNSPKPLSRPQENLPISDGDTIQRMSPEQANTQKRSVLANKSNPKMNGIDAEAEESSQWSTEDVEEWLALTGFFDYSYRTKVLSRRRRLKAIEEERTQLLLEEQEDQNQRNQLARDQSVLGISRATPQETSYLARAPSILAMPPPSFPTITNKDLGFKIKDLAVNNDRLLKSIEGSNTSTPKGSLKRKNSDTVRDSPKPQQPEKKLRPAASSKQSNPLADSVEVMSEPQSTKHQKESGRSGGRQSSASPSMFPRKLPRSSGDEPPDSVRNRSRGSSPTASSTKMKYDHWNAQKNDSYDDRRRSSFESRDPYRFSESRADRRYLYHDHDRERARRGFQSPDRLGGYDREYGRYRRESTGNASRARVGTSSLRAGGTRYFLLKSWNYENIELAQSECTWATQTKNEETFVDAFKTRRHVILIFSANYSKAFQGYARMQCLPGDSDVEEPSWRKNLHWPTTQPFKIRWIAKSNTPYRAVGSLKNPLNDNLPVFVGRDGQEIDESVGAELCELIDEDSRLHPTDFRS